MEARDSFGPEMFQNKKVIVFGAGGTIERVVEEIESFAAVTYIVDNDTKKQGTIIAKKTVFPPSQLLVEEKSDLLIIIVSSRYTEIAEQLNNLGFQENIHYYNGDVFIYKRTQRGFSYNKIISHATYTPWMDDSAFLASYEICKDYTLVDIHRCYDLWSLVEQTASLDGSILEVGVWKGGTGTLIAKQAKLSKPDTSKVFLCDTFAGVVKSGKNDSYYRDGEHSDTNESIVMALLAEIKLDNAEILKGIFPDDTSSEIEDLKFRFCHIDVDVYESAKSVFEWVWSRLVIGGIVVFDDYGFATCDGITAYVNDELKPREDLVFIHNLNGHAILIKTK